MEPKKRMQKFWGALITPTMALSCLFPCFMLFVEWIFRVSNSAAVAAASNVAASTIATTATTNVAATSSIGTIDFFGPSLAAAGIGFLVPLTAPKLLKINIDTSKIKIDASQITIRDKADETFSQFVWVVILIFLAVWMGTLQLSSKHSSVLFLGTAIHIWLGLFNYFVGIILSCVKEAI